MQCCVTWQLHYAANKAMNGPRSQDRQNSKGPGAVATSRVDRICDQVRTMATDFAIKPDERINEGALASTLGVSRTPLREALNRLVAEGFITFQTGRGFFNRSLQPEKVLELYELRQAIECEALRRAIDRASDDGIAELREFLVATEPSYSAGASAKVLVDLDEQFHMRLAELSRNSELVRMLRNVSERIRYVRWIVMTERQGRTHSEHIRILDALAARDTDAAVEAMRGHIEQHSEEATAAVRIAYSQLYVPG